MHGTEDCTGGRVAQHRASGTQVEGTARGNVAGVDEGRRCRWSSVAHGYVMERRGMCDAASVEPSGRNPAARAVEA
eukprot:2997566-Prymnesium_polylepis.2